jgi:hypothetical protein
MLRAIADRPSAETVPLPSCYGRQETFTSYPECLMNFPIWCACGKEVLFSNETRCEDCFANDSEKFKAPSSHPYNPGYTYEEIIERDRQNEQQLSRSRFL